MSSIKEIPIGEIALTTGSTVTINTGAVTASSPNVSDSAVVYRVTGTETLSVSDFTIAPTGAATKNIRIEILWDATCTLNGNSVIIFGTTMPDELFETSSTDTKFSAVCIYDGTAWKVTTSADIAGLGFVGTAALADDAVTTAKILDANVTTAKILDANVTTTKIADANVTTVKIADSSVTTAKILDANVTTAKILDANVTDVKLAANAVTTAKIADANVTTAKIADDAVTNAKLEDNANRYTRDIRISFLTAGEIGVLNFIMPEDCDVEQVSGTVMQPFATDTGTVIFKNNAGTVMTGSQIDFTTGLVLGNQVTNTVTGNNSFTAGQKITLELSKTTAGSGIANISLCIIKT